MHMRPAKWNRVFALLLSLLLIISLPACSKPEIQEAAAPVATIAPIAPRATPEPSETEAGGEPEPESSEADLDDGTSFESNDGLVTEFHAIQVMAKGLDTETGALFDMTQFVAGKSTLLRVAFDGEVDVEQDGSMYVTIYRDGNEVAQLLPMNQGEYEETYFAPRNAKDVDNWAAGKYEFEFVYGDSTATRTLTMRESQTIKVLAVPVLANYGGRIVPCEGEWKTAIQLTRDAYPLADDGIEYVLGNELDLSDNMYDLLTDEGQYNVWEALCGLQTPNEDYRLILGFVRERQGEDRNLQGYTYGKPANVITESDGDMQPTVSHEIAHCYFIGDEYNGGSLNPKVNPPPYGMEGNDFNDREVPVVGDLEANITAREYGSDNSGSLIYPEQMPFNTTLWKRFSVVGSFMGSGSDNLDEYWVTSDIWSQLYKAFVLGGVEDERASSGSAPGCPGCYEGFNTETFDMYAECSECGEYTQIGGDDVTFVCGGCGGANELDINTVVIVCPKCEEEFLVSQLAGKKDSKEAALGKGAPTAEPEELRVLDIAGTVYASGSFTAKPWYAYEGLTSDVTVKRSGAYAVVMEDASGQALSTQYFDVSFYNLHQPDKKDYAPVSITVRYPENVAAVKIMQGANELYRASVSAGAPKISFTDVKKNQQFKGKTEIKWSGADDDGDTLYYDLWYCPGEDEFINLASDITQTSCTVNFDDLPGTDEGYFYIYATDGINTSEAASEWIKAEYMAPEIISTQATVPEYKITDEIILDADIYDAQDGWLYDEGVSWSLKGRGEYMSGSFLWVYPYELTPGEHVFTLTAANSKGKTASKEFKFRIIDDESALPNDWSREDIKSALSSGFIAPLRNVNAAITRGQFAALMANLYWELWGVELPMPEFDYEEGVVTDCGEDDYDQFLMVKLGVMDAPGGKFNPNGNLTEEEAAAILYRVTMLALPDEDHFNDPIETIVSDCLEAGVMEQGGDNAYNASAKITGRLALVRCNRLYQFLFGGA